MENLLIYDKCTYIFFKNLIKRSIFADRFNRLKDNILKKFL